jgi:ubiquitin-conjugating enzyme E2 variant
VIVLKIIVCLLIADFLSGLFHWLVDAYSPKSNAFIKRHITDPVILHHFRSREFTKNSWIKSAWVPMIAAFFVGLGFYFFVGFNWMVFLTLFIAINGQEVHKWSHRTKAENGWLITLLQKIKIVQTRRHHAAHHKNPNNCTYCVITNYLNPILDKMHFWEMLERVVYRLTGISRFDYSVKPDMVRWHAQK